MPLYLQSIESVLKTLRTRQSGLSLQEVAERQKEYGQNALPEARTVPLWMLFLEQFYSPLIGVLILAAITVFLLGEPVDALVVLAVLLVNAVIGAFQEGRAQQTLLALKHFVESKAVVLRDGQEMTVLSATIVPGDILVLREGDKVAADARIIEAESVRVDESALTGESLPVPKKPGTLEKESPLTEQYMCLFSGTNIVRGRASAVVVATGEKTVVGGIASDIVRVNTDVPLKRDVARLSQQILYAVAVLCVGLVLLGMARGESLFTMFGVAVSLAVSVIPEGLPVVLTVVLATGVWRMGKRNALVKKLQAVEALGQATVIAVDKTGTLTMNQLMVESVWTPVAEFGFSGRGYESHGDVTIEGKVAVPVNHPELLEVGKVMALLSSARVSFDTETGKYEVAGDPTEAALLVAAQKVGIAREQLLEELSIVADEPFTNELNYHAIVVREKVTSFTAIAGSPEQLLTRVATVYNKPASAEVQAQLMKALQRMVGRGERVVALLRKHVSHTASSPDVEAMEFVAFVGMRDVLREEAKSAVQKAKEAGIKVVMITGDHAVTARAIATEVGIFASGDTVMTGAELLALTDEALAKRIGSVSVFARVTPEHKMRIVQAYRARGETVAMTGDGVNDAPPLVAADLGVAMGKSGTEVAKEAADIVLLDDNFASIVAAVEEGRNIYISIKKVILYLFSTSLGEVIVIVGALIVGLPLPLLAAQIIWLNFVTDGFLNIGLALEPKSALVMKGTKFRSKTLIDRTMVLRMLTMAIPMAAVSLLVFSWYLDNAPEKALTASLTILAIFQWWNAWNCRATLRSVFSMSPFTNPALIISTLIVIALQVIAVYVPFMQDILHTVPLSFGEWLALAGLALTIVVVEEIRKMMHRAMEPELTAGTSKE